MNRYLLLIAVFAGIVLGGLVSKFLFVGSFLNLVLWGAVGIAIGFLSENKTHAIRNGAVYGFVLSFVFMFTGYEGSAAIITRIPFFTILGLFGGVCGLILALLGQLGKSLQKRNT